MDARLDRGTCCLPIVLASSLLKKAGSLVWHWLPAGATGGIIFKRSKRLLDHRLEAGATLFLQAASVAMLLGVVGCASPGGQSRGSWTIRCAESQGPGAYERMQGVAQLLRRTQGIRPDDVLVMQDADGFTRLYYGAYDRKRDAKTGKRSFPPNMRADMNLLRDLGDEAGRRYFARAMPARRPTPDVGNPAWSLRTVRATYTLQVGVFEPTDDFRQFKFAAAEYCRLLREKGHEAYYYHTDVSSLVTVGTFGPEAVIRSANGRVSYSSEVRAIQAKEPLQRNTVNGAILRERTADGQLVTTPSFLVKLPKTVGPS